MKNQSADSFGPVRDQASQLLQSIIEQATAKATSQNITGRQSGKSRIPFRSNKSSSARDVALTAAEVAIDLWQTALDRASGTVDGVHSTVGQSAREVGQTAQHLRSQAGEHAQAVGSTVTDTAKDIGQSAQQLKSDVGAKAQNVGTTVAGTAQTVGSSVTGATQLVAGSVGSAAQKAGDTTRAVAYNTASGGKNTFGFLFWTAAAGAVVYWAFLDDDLRAKARSYAVSALEEIQAVLDDYRGADGEFQGEQ